MKRRSVRYSVCWLLCLITLGAGSAAQADPGDGLRRLLGGLGETLGRLSGTYLEPTPGAISFETAVEHKGLGRPVLYIRPEVESPEKAPAVVMLSYSHTTPQTMANVVNAGELAAKYGVWVILPRAVLRHWQASPRRISPRDDVGFLAKVIQDATQRYPIDPNRVYMAGLSNGGYMVTKFACEHPELLAGIATVGATIRTQQVERCNDSAPLPLLMVNGTRDGLSPYDGRLGLLSVEQTIDYWSNRNGCADATQAQRRLPDTADDGMYTTVDDIQGCSSGADIQLLTVVGGGHSWPGADTFVTGNDLSSSTADFSATIKLWEFLRQFSRQQNNAAVTDNNVTTVNNG